MRLQLAIDTQTLPEAEAPVSRVRDLVDVVEVTAATAPAVAALSPDIVVVGSAIARAADPRAAAAALRRALGEERQ